MAIIFVYPLSHYRVKPANTVSVSGKASKEKKEGVKEVSLKGIFHTFSTHIPLVL